MATSTYLGPPSAQSQQRFSSAQSPPAPGSMGPPSRPADRSAGGARPKATDINDLSDAVLAAGVDLADEESYLLDIYANRQTKTPYNSFRTQASSTISPNDSFGWSQGGGAALPGSGVLSQEGRSPEDLEKELKRAHQAAALALNEHHANHLHDPFLTGNPLRHRLHRRAYENGVQLSVEGLYDKIPDTPQGAQGRMYMDPSGREGVAAMKAHSLLSQDVPLAELLTLISLAANERMRGILEEAYALSRNRQVSSHGIVPPDFADIAVGDNPKDTSVRPASVSGTDWDRPFGEAMSPKANPLKREHPESNSLPTPPTDSSPSEAKTVFFQNPLINSFRSIAKRDKEFEEARLAKRQKRKKTSTATSEAASPAAAEAAVAADVAAVNAKMTKKERDKMNKANQTDDVLHREANKTATLALGGGGKKYAWMSGGAGGGLSSGTSTPKAKSALARKPANSAGAKEGVIGNLRSYGAFREDGPKGKGIQMRDLLAVLEQDGKEKKTLVRAQTMLKSHDDAPAAPNSAR